MSFRQNLLPEIVNFFRLREEAVPADVEMKTLVSRGAGDAADINRICLQDGDLDVVF